MNQVLLYKVVEKNDLLENISEFVTDDLGLALSDVLLKSRYSSCLSEAVRTDPKTSVQTKSKLFDITKQSKPGIALTCNIKNINYNKPFSTIQLTTVKGDSLYPKGFSNNSAYFYLSQDYKNLLDITSEIISSLLTKNQYAALTLALFAIRDTRHFLWAEIPSLNDE